MALEFGDMSRRGQWSVIGLVCVVLIVVFYYYVYSPGMEETTQMRAQIAQLRLDNQRTLEIANQLPQLEAELAQLETRLEILKTILPEAQQTDFLLRIVQRAAADSNLEIRRFTFQSQVLHDFYAEMPLELDVTGTYHNLALFFDRISKFARIITVGQVSIQALTDGTGGTVQSTFTASTFFFLPDEEVEAADLAADPTTAGS